MSTFTPSPHFAKIIDKKGEEMIKKIEEAAAQKDSAKRRETTFRHQVDINRPRNVSYGDAYKMADFGRNFHKRPHYNPYGN